MTKFRRSVLFLQDGDSFRVIRCNLKIRMDSRKRETKSAAKCIGEFGYKNSSQDTAQVVISSSCKRL